MKKNSNRLKHNKIRNTGLIFEILTKKFTSETLDGKKPLSVAIIKKHYKQGTELSKELKLYEALGKRRNKFTAEYIDTCIQLKDKIDQKKLQEEKFQLVKTLKKIYNLNEFFNIRIGNYKLQASIFKLLEYKKEDNPEDYFNTKELVLEHMEGKDPEYTKKPYDDLLQEDKTTLRLGLKFIVERFNKKYKNLNERQKRLLQEYINKDIRSEDFKKFIFTEVNSLVRRLGTIVVKDIVTKTKLHECTNLMGEILKSKVIRDEHLDSLLKFYRLEELLENE